MPAKKQNPIRKDPHDSEAFGLKGRIVTMKSEKDIIESGIVYIKDSLIVAVVKSGEPVPAACKNFPVLQTGGTIFPGMIELHNHLSYNCLPLWPVPAKFENRDQWSRLDLYKNLISGPMNILGKTPGYVEAIVRYVECKCLVAGVTTSQGIMLASNGGIRTFYRGIVRNVESPDDPNLPKVDGHIPDIAARDAGHFFNHLKKTSCLLLHLSEGTNASAYKHFEDLRINEEEWAITDALTGIHCVALKSADFKRLKKKGASIVWSPLSNLMLYGATANVKAARASGIKIGIGSDWSPSGSKNLLGELKVARLFSQQNGNIFSDFELISMATMQAARIIKWDKQIGSIEKGKLADLVVFDSKTGNPFQKFFDATEKNISLVLINGEARFGSQKLMKKLGGKTETVNIGKLSRSLNLHQESGNEVVGKLLLSEAASKLKKGLADLKKLSRKMPALKAMEGPDNSKIMVPDSGTNHNGTEKKSFVLVLDHDGEEGEEIRRNPMAGPDMRELLKTVAAEIPPIQLDPLCVVNDKKYFKNLQSSPNLPDYIKTGLKKMYKGFDF